MVKIPALELDGQNWKIYRAKLLEHAATKGWLDVLAGGPDNRTNDWEGCNALLHELLHDTIPISIYIRLRRNTAHQVFKHLAKRFHDRDPITDPRAKKLATCANEAKRYSSAKTPTSENAATGADREDPPTKDLIRGTKDVDDKNVGREDPRTKAEALSKGTSAKCTETTPVVLESAPHETQKPPQDSLQTTPRLPTEGKPSECKQEVTGSVVMAGRTNGTVGMTEPRKTDADVDLTPTLGREPVTRDCGVDEGDGDREYQSRIQQTEFSCKESRQHDKNENANVPNAHGLPLEGEWTVCASGEASDWNGDANASNAAVERVDSPNESRVTEDTPGVESEGCERGTSEGACVDEEDGDPGRRVEPADTQNESDTLVTTSIASESPDSGGIPRVHLGSTIWRAGDANGIGNRTEGSGGQADVSRGLTGTLDVPNGAGTAGMSDGEGAETYLGVRDAKRVVHATDGVGTHADTSSGYGDAPSVETDTLTTANATEIVSTPPRRKKPPDSPVSTIRRTPDEPNGCRNHADASSARTYAYCVGNDAETVGNATKNVRTYQIERKTQDSPTGREIATPKPTSRWRKVSPHGIDVYVPWNAPVEVLGTVNRRIVFGRVESGDEAIAPSVEGERAGEGDGGGYGDDGDVGDTMNGGGVHSTRVKAALLAGESQHTCQSRRIQNNDLPVSSWPPVQRERRPYGHVRRRRRRGRLKIERINVSKAQRVETTHLAHAHATQPPGYDPNRAYGVVRPRRRRGRIKIEPRNVSRTQMVGTTHLGRDNALRSTWRPKKRVRRVNKLTFKYRMPGEPWRDDGEYG